MTLKQKRIESLKKHNNVYINRMLLYYDQGIVWVYCNKNILEQELLGYISLSTACKYILGSIKKFKIKSF